MTGGLRVPARVVALLALFVLAGVGLRGYLPENPPVEEQSKGSSVSLVAVILVLAAAMAVVTIAIIASLKNPQSGPGAGSGGPSRRDGGEKWRPNWRNVLIAVGVVIVWLIFVMVMVRLVSPDVDGVTPAEQPTTAPNGSKTLPPPSGEKPGSPEGGGDVFWYLAAASALMIGLLVVAGVATVRKRMAGRGIYVDEEAHERGAVPDGDPLAVAAALGLAKVGDRSREPREAIIACYAAMENALAGSPLTKPQDSDTPTEVLARAVGTKAIRAGTANDLVDLFAEARFSPHLMTEAHRSAAEGALRRVLGDLENARTLA